MNVGQTYGGEAVLNRSLRVNDRIRAKEIRVIGAEGEQLGIMTPREALAMAQGLDLDLIEVAPNSVPSVCKIMDYGRYKYEQRKREKDQAKTQRGGEMKTVRIRPATDDHDLKTKENTARKFLGENRKVKFNMMFRGREHAYRDLASAKLLRVAENLQDIAVLERRPAMDGRTMIMILAPKADSQQGMKESQ